MTIRSVLIINNHGKPRLTKFYSPLSTSKQQQLIRLIFSLVSSREATHNPNGNSDSLVCNFLDAPELLPLLPPSTHATHLNFKSTSTRNQKDNKGKDKAKDRKEAEDELRVIYRHYATLYFVFVADTSESELGILDLIQVFVESLDRCFENVCELDLIFHFDEVHAILSEVIQGGLVVETNINDIVAAAKQTTLSRKASSQSSTGGGGLSSFGPAPPGHSTTSSLSIPGSPGWGRPNSPGLGGGGSSGGGWGGLVEGWGRELGSRLGR